MLLVSEYPRGQLLHETARMPLHASCILTTHVYVFAAPVSTPGRDTTKRPLPRKTTSGEYFVPPNKILLSFGKFESVYWLLINWVIRVSVFSTFWCAISSFIASWRAAPIMCRVLRA